MSVELDQCNCVVLGTWNPGIITPQWLKQQKIYAQIPDQIALGFQPLSRAIRFELDGLAWEVSDSRLSVTSKTGKNCGQVIAKVLEVLPHTPLQAIGTNFVYKGSAEAWKSDLIPEVRSLQLAPGKQTRLSQVIWSGLLDLDENTVMNLSVTNSLTGVVVAFNLHRNCDTAKTAKRFAIRWQYDLRLVKGLLRSEFKVRI